jgi:SagB-type dehydrogenase family enzyme
LTSLLEPIANSPEDVLIRTALDREHAPEIDNPLIVENPAFFILYLVHLDKAVARYRYRGYRFALVEAGAMCQQCDLVAQSLDLGSCLYGGFGDNELAVAVGVNPAILLPVVVQFFGYSRS